jgi:hypothetical protein
MDISTSPATVATNSSSSSVDLAQDVGFGLPSASPCRFCSTPLTTTFVNLGTSPLCQDHVRPQNFNKAEPFYPLHARVCKECFLVQLDEFVSPTEVFNDYAYFSSYSASWLRHAHRYTDMV